MAAKGVSVLKFVGTVSLGVMTVRATHRNFSDVPYVMNAIRLR